MFQMSSAQASKFVEAAQVMTEKIAELGPNPLRVSINENMNSEEDEL